MIKDTKYYSKCINDIAKGCKLCVQGRKLVLFVTGICPRSCYYCPLSDKKYHKDVVYANETPVDLNENEDKQIKAIIQEAKTNQAKGAGITGGDPLSKLERTISYIKALKKEFGEHFHIHLYTSFDLVTKDTLKQLYDAKLDEIRFHPDIEDDKQWNKIEIVKQFDWDIGIEIPVIPKKKRETIKLLNYFKDKVNFINLNELEISDNNASKLGELDYCTKDDISYGIKGSEELAEELLKHLDNEKIKVHYCTARLKDAVQMKNRLILRAKSIARYYETINDDGTITRAIIYLEQPYTKKQLIELDKEKTIKKLEQVKEKLKNIKTEIDTKKFRLITHIKYFKKDKNIEFIKDLGLLPAIVTEYPTYDAFELDINFL